MTWHTPSLKLKRVTTEEGTQAAASNAEHERKLLIEGGGFEDGELQHFAVFVRRHRQTYGLEEVIPCNEVRKLPPKPGVRQRLEVKICPRLKVTGFYNLIAWSLPPAAITFRGVTQSVPVNDVAFLPNALLITDGHPDPDGGDIVIQASLGPDEGGPGGGPAIGVGELVASVAKVAMIAGGGGKSARDKGRNTAKKARGAKPTSGKAANPKKTAPKKKAPAKKASKKKSPNKPSS